PLLINLLSVQDALPISWLVGDVGDPDDVERVFEVVRPDVVFQLASRVAGDRDVELVQPMLADNLLGAVNVLVAAERRGQPRVVLDRKSTRLNSSHVSIS